MALPWSAPGYGQGIFPGQAPFYPPAAVDPHLIAAILANQERRRQDISSSIQSAMAGLGSLIEQHRQDAIASQLLAGSAPKAEAVAGQTPAAQPATTPADSVYAERGLTDESGQALSPTGVPITAPATPPASLATFRPVGAPSTVLSPAEAAHNAALGFPAQQLMRPSEIYKAQQDLYSQNLGDMLKQAHVARLLELAGGGQGGERAPVGKIWSTSLGGWATPKQDADERRRQAAEAGGVMDAGAKQFYKDTEAKTGLTKDILEKLDTTTPYDPSNPATIKYVDQTGKVISTDEANNLLKYEVAGQPRAFAASSSFKGQIPLEAFRTMIAKHQNIQSSIKPPPSPTAAAGLGGYSRLVRQNGVLYRVYPDGSSEAVVR